MGLVIEVRDGAGRVVGETGESLPNKLFPIPSSNDASFPLLRGLDPYIDTTFSSVQMRWLVPELEALRETVGGDGEKRLIDEVLDLAHVCAKSPHHVLVFVSD